MTQATDRHSLCFRITGNERRRHRHHRRTSILRRRINIPIPVLRMRRRKPRRNRIVKRIFDRTAGGGDIFARIAPRSQTPRDRPGRNGHGCLFNAVLRPRFMFGSVHVKVYLTWGRPRHLLSLLARASDDRDRHRDNRRHLRLRLRRCLRLRFRLRLLFRRRGWRHLILVFRARSNILEKRALFLRDRNWGRLVLLLSSAADEQISAVLRRGDYRRFRCIARCTFNRQW